MALTEPELLEKLQRQSPDPDARSALEVWKAAEQTLRDAKTACVLARRNYYRAARLAQRPTKPDGLECTRCGELWEDHASVTDHEFKDMHLKTWPRQ